jgi:hypothetical protein
VSTDLAGRLSELLGVVVDLHLVPLDLLCLVLEGQFPAVLGEEDRVTEPGPR